MSEFLARAIIGLEGKPGSAIFLAVSTPTLGVFGGHADEALFARSCFQPLPTVWVFSIVEF